MTVNIGDKAPDFDLPTYSASHLSLKRPPGQKRSAVFLSEGYDPRLHNRGNGFSRPRRCLCQGEHGNRRRFKGQFRTP